MKTGIELIAIERQEQVRKHGFNKDHDEQHSKGELINAAIYLLTGCSRYFPSWGDKCYSQFKKAYKDMDKTKALKIAGALIAAEIDRIQSR